MGLIEDVVQATEEYESPKTYVYWATLCAVSAIVKKNVYLDRYQSILYPNLYVMLMGPSGMKKSLPIDVCCGLVEEVNNTRVITGRGSIQAVLTELASTKTKEGGGAPPIGSQALIAAQEFSTFLVKDDSALPILIDLYDPRKEYKNRLKGSGTEVLKDTYITMLGASNHELMATVMTDAVAMGGFVSRTIVVVEDTVEKFNSLVRPPKFKLDYTKLGKRLHEISHMKGAMSYGPGAAKFFDDWYQDFRRRSLLVDDRHGIARRMDSQILKTAMLTTLAYEDSLILTIPRLEDAMTRCIKHGSEAHRMTQTAGKQPLATQSAWILEELARKPDHSMTRMQILRKYTKDLNHHDLDNIVEHLYQAKILHIHTQGRDTKYEMDEKYAVAYLNYLQSKKSGAGDTH
jgi:hypothetical protein